VSAVTASSNGLAHRALKAPPLVKTYPMTAYEDIRIGAYRIPVSERFLASSDKRAQLRASQALFGSGNTPVTKAREVAAAMTNQSEAP